MTTMQIRTFLKIAPILPKDTSVLLRGGHGIGKSQLVRQVAAIIAKNGNLSNFEVIDRRLSQMSEGDMIGLPSTDGEVTRFNPPEWYKRACEKPVCLFLDELNRATPEVMQAAFQIVLDRELNGCKLHPETRVFSAINTGGAYTVNEMDPALLDRFWAIDLTPDVIDWLAWAKESNNINEHIISFIAGNDKWLDPPKNCDNSTISPSRRSWERLSIALTQINLTEDPNNAAFYPVCLGYIGTEATIAYHGFMKTIDLQVSGKEIIEDFSNVKNKIEKLGQEKLNIAIEKVAHYITTNITVLDNNQGSNLKEFMDYLPAELRISAWSKLTAGGIEKLELAKSIHKWCVEGVLAVFSIEKATSDVDEGAVDTKATQSTKRTAKKK